MFETVQAGFLPLFKSLLIALIACLAWAQGVLFSAAYAGAAEWEKSTKLGAEAFKDNRYGEAERQFQTAISEAKKFGRNDLRLATSYANLGVLYNSRGWFDKAEPLFEQSVAIKQKTLGPFNIDVIDSAARLCQFYLKRRKYDKADPLFERIAQFADMQIRDYNNMRNSFKQLAEFYKHHQELEKVRTMLIEMEQMTNSKSNNECLELAVLLDQVADAYQAENGKTFRAQNAAAPPTRNADLERLYKQALTLREHVLSGNHLALAQSYANLGKLYAGEGRQAIAEPLLKKAYNVCRDTIGSAKPKTYEYLETYAQTLIALDHTQTAEHLYRQALEIFESGYGKNSSYVADIDLGLATVLEHHGQYQEAAKLVGSALKIKERIYGPHHASLASILDKYSYLLNKSARQKEALKQQARANQIRS